MSSQAGSIKLKAKNKKNTVKKVSPFMDAKFCHGIMTNNNKGTLGLTNTLTQAPPQSNKKEDRHGGPQELGKEKVSSHAGSKIYKAIPSPHLLSQKITVPPKKKKYRQEGKCVHANAKFCHVNMTNNEQ